MSEKGEKVLQFPISGKKVSINTDVHMNPKLLNSDPESKGWICKVKPFDDKLKQETESLLNEEAYKKLIK
ncbi:hypothetical protein BGZ46_009521 [Entomortierella lignicola]|nr:hypothetical protein BGZ46_009521 [Entomortierella lignicola]